MNNPKQHPADQVDKIASSIKNYGFTVPMVIDGKNEIIMGHGRLQAAKKLGMEEVPCIVRDDLTEAQRKGLRIADNRVGESEWDIEILLAEIDGLEDFTGFSLDEMENLTDMFDIDGIDPPVLNDGDRTPFQQMTFTLHDEQAEAVKAAVAMAKDRGAGDSVMNENRNGNALYFICEAFING